MVLKVCVPERHFPVIGFFPKKSGESDARSKRRIFFMFDNYFESKVRIEFSPLGLINVINGHYYTLETTDMTSSW